LAGSIPRRFDHLRRPDRQAEKSTANESIKRNDWVVDAWYGARWKNRAETKRCGRETARGAAGRDQSPRGQVLYGLKRLPAPAQSPCRQVPGRIQATNADRGPWCNCRTQGPRTNCRAARSHHLSARADGGLGECGRLRKEEDCPNEAGQLGRHGPAPLRGINLFQPTYHQTTWFGSIRMFY